MLLASFCAPEALLIPRGTERSPGETPDVIIDRRRSIYETHLEGGFEPVPCGSFLTSRNSFSFCTMGSAKTEI